MKPLIACLLAAALAAACAEREAPAETGGEGGGAVATPSALLGTWGSDCERPEIRLAAESIEVFADGTTYPLTSAASADGELVLGYDGPSGPIEETYLVEGETLTLVEGAYEGVAVNWNKQPMRRCDAA